MFDNVVSIVFVHHVSIDSFCNNEVNIIEVCVFSFSLCVFIYCLMLCVIFLVTVVCSFSWFLAPFDSYYVKEYYLQYICIFITV